ncbi:MAG: hypothetical protein KA956_03120 [Pyrinomonadaceae bacterium]|nr:hypothetical protein [Acidobacteriota bacterium]MBK7932869.1 hypothetical protein [Acidobacteriota bacterium]MBP7375452.1 hypothetical protein [Pyrinomonadaceae bacterium]
MSNKTIANFWFFVIFSASVAAIFSGCSMTSAGNSRAAAVSNFEAVKTTGKIENAEITESSGVTASRCQPNVYWTHNDSGDDAYIFAMDRSGARLGTWKVPNASNVDWEDIALFKDSAGKCFIYIGEIGDNQSKRDDRTIYRIPEPKASAENASATKRQPLTSEPADAIRFTYPDSRHNAETLLVHPKSGDIYILTKRVSGPAGVYRLKPEFGKESTVRAEKVADISVPAIPNGFLTGGDISPDGRHVIICDYTAAYEFTLPDGAKSFDDIWSQAPESIDVGARKIGEAVTYTSDGRSIILTSEGKNSPVLEVIRKN